MAYNFLQASVQSFEADNQITSIGVPMTVSVRQRYPNTSSNRQLWAICESLASFNNSYFAFNNTSANLELMLRTTSGVSSEVALPGTNQWFNALGVFASTTSRTAYVNTTAGNTNTTNRSITTETSILIGRRSGGGNSFTGQLAEFAIWNATLTADEINSLAQGFKPPRIRPQSLLYYVPLVRDVQELRSGIPFTAVNAPTVFDHPRVY
jgi:hypothetical protein